MAIVNEMRIDFPSLSNNEAFARMVISGFILPLDPTVEELADIKTAVSEAVTNAIVHGYPERRGFDTNSNSWKWISVQYGENHSGNPSQGRKRLL